MTRTPLRVTFAGDGTDVPAFYELHHGAVLSTAIDCYVYVTVKRHSELFLEPIRLNYSKSEEVERIDELENEIARECLRLLEVEPPIYISTVGDVPASAGLGGSSAFAVGLLNALHAFRGERVSAGHLAEEAAHVEIDVLGKPVGKQDSYAAAFGGLNVFRFDGSGGVSVQHQPLRGDKREALLASILMFWTGHQPSTASRSTEQALPTPPRVTELERLRDHVQEVSAIVTSPGTLDLAELGRVLTESWEIERKLAGVTASTQIDRWFARGIATGATGGRLCGSGGGFLLFVVEPERQQNVCLALPELVQREIAYEARGSQIVIPFD
jgi:D-glycero-alpha-D-manno-heptose-7-phosphate kinase